MQGDKEGTPTVPVPKGPDTGYGGGEDTLLPISDCSRLLIE
jgi:hypothetical protein